MDNLKAFYLSLTRRGKVILAVVLLILAAGVVELLS